VDFPTFNFDAMSESDVREEIIAPLIRFLGYRTGTENDVIREQSLSYPRLSLGRQKNSDPLVRGRADYICVAGGIVRWAIEAKAPGVAVDSVAEEQAWTYANHPEIRAVYFFLVNGHEFKLFQTNHGPQSPALFSCTYDELREKLTAVVNILAPASVLRDHPRAVVDVGLPIGPGLRSIVRVTNGSILFSSNSMNIPPLVGMTMTVTGGSVERNEAGRLEAHLSAIVPFQSLQTLNEKLGLDEMHLTSLSEALSTDEGSPTVFESTRSVVLPKGEVALDMLSWKQVALPMNITATVHTKATGVLRGNEFAGEFVGTFTYKEIHLLLIALGTFRIHLA
jgi:hypothetical protein